MRLDWHVWAGHRVSRVGQAGCPRVRARLRSARSTTPLRGQVRTLGFVLLNPPSRAGHVTRRHVDAGCAALGYAKWEIANLFADATGDLDEVNAVGADPAGWIAARGDLERLVCHADSLLIGWGVGGLRGRARKLQSEQINWLASVAFDRGHRTWWTLGGEPRHPSRWHQYVSDKHGRATGDTLIDRIRSVAVELPIATSTGRGHR